MRITADGVTVTVGAATLLDDVSVSAEPGQFLGLVGPNGAGKSTLLRVLAGLRDCARGVVRYDCRTRASYRQLIVATARLSRTARAVAWP